MVASFFPLPLVSSQPLSSKEFSHPAFDLICSISPWPRSCSRDWSNISHISASLSQDVTRASFLDVNVCLFCLKHILVGQRSMQKWLKCEQDSAWNIIRCRLSKNLTKESETLEEVWRGRGPRGGWGRLEHPWASPRAPWSVAEKHCNNESLCRPTWLTLRREVGHCSDKANNSLSAGLQQPLNTNIKTISARVLPCSSVCCVVSIRVPYAQSWEGEPHIACCSLDLACLIQTTTNTTYVLISSVRFFFQTRVTRESLMLCCCKASFNTWQTMNVRSFTGWCVIESRISLDVHHQVCGVFWPIVVSVSSSTLLGDFPWACGDGKAYGTVSLCFLSLAICPLVPITLPSKRLNR